MKTFEQFSPEAQQAIEKFKKNFWKKVEAVPCFNDVSKMFDSGRPDFLIGLVDGFMIFHGCNGEELGDVFKYIVRQNFYSKRYVEMMEEAE